MKYEVNDIVALYNDKQALIVDIKSEKYVAHIIKQNHKPGREVRITDNDIVMKVTRI